MTYFAFQRHPGGHECPVIYDEYPSKENVGIANAACIIKGSIKQIPPELEGMSPTQVIAFIKNVVEPKDVPKIEGFKTEGFKTHMEIERMRAEVLSERNERDKVIAALRGKDKAMGVLFCRLNKASVDCSDLIS